MLLRNLALFLTVAGMGFWGEGVATPYVLGELNGRLGNQCFEVAATCALAWDHNAQPYFPDFKEKECFDLSLNYQNVFWRFSAERPSAPSQLRYVALQLNYIPLPYAPNMTLVGYFQSAKYFEKYKERICALLAPSDAILHYLNTKYAAILNHPLSVGVHFRDYGKEDLFYGARHGVLTKAYYKKAFAHFPKKALFVVFSDNIAWCKENLSDLSRHIVFVEKEASYHDFYLMSLCKHAILSNSTFSWWAAYQQFPPENGKHLKFSCLKIYTNYLTDPGLGSSQWLPKSLKNSHIRNRALRDMAVQL